MRFIPTKHRDSLVLAPFDLSATQFMAGLTSGEPITMEIVHDRDMVEHRKIFAQIGELAKAMHRPPESVRAELLYKCGQFSVLGELFGKVLISINSMDRHHMKDHELHAFWDDAVEIIRTEMLPTIPDAAERERLAATILPDAVGSAVG